MNGDKILNKCKLRTQETHLTTVQVDKASVWNYKSYNYENLITK